ncbi:tyrosine-type recombinase/integrase [Tsuneonella sp. HG222]
MDLDFSIIQGADCNWLSGPEGASSDWGSLPHTLYGATPAGPAVRKAIKKVCKRGAGPSRPRRYEAASLRELRASLDLRSFDPGLCPIPVLRHGSPAAAKRHVRPTKRAEVLEKHQLERVLAHIDQNSRSPEAGRLKLLLAHLAGLRAGEIAELTVNACLDVERRHPAKTIFIGKAISKSLVDREVPMHPWIAEAVVRFRKRHPDATHVAHSIGRAGTLRRQNAAAVTNWFCRLYKDAGFPGCSSHTGRRSFATHFARRMHNTRASIANLQQLMGHRRLSSTECYLEPAADVTELVHGL